MISGVLSGDIERAPIAAVSATIPQPYQATRPNTATKAARPRISSAARIGRGKWM